MNKKEIQKQQYISMKKFLRDYCHLENEHLIEMLSSLSHKELKEVCNELYKLELMTLPFNIVSTEEVKRGDVLFVNDAFYNPAPYKNPRKKELEDLLFDDLELFEDEEEKELFSSDIISQNVKVKKINRKGSR